MFTPETKGDSVICCNSSGEYWLASWPTAPTVREPARAHTMHHNADPTVQFNFSSFSLIAPIHNKKSTQVTLQIKQTYQIYPYIVFDAANT